MSPLTVTSAESPNPREPLPSMQNPPIIENNWHSWLQLEHILILLAPQNLLPQPHRLVPILHLLLIRPSIHRSSIIWVPPQLQQLAINGVVDEGGHCGVGTNTDVLVTRSVGRNPDLRQDLVCVGVFFAENVGSAESVNEERLATLTAGVREHME